MSELEIDRLSAREKTRLAELARLRFIRVRNGYRVVGRADVLTLKMFDRLSGMGLVREANETGRKTAILTGKGRTVLGILEERKARHKGGTTPPAPLQERYP